MKGSNGVRFAVAIIVGLVSFFGLTSGIPLAMCGYFFNEYNSAYKMSEKRRNELENQQGVYDLPKYWGEDLSKRFPERANYKGRKAQVEAEFHIAAKEAKYNMFCRPLQVVTGDSMVEIGALKKGISYITVTLIIDGIVLGAYQFFGKSKENKELVEKDESKKKVV